MLMAYNVGAFGKYKENSTADAASIIKEIGAETVAVCELDSCNARHGSYQLEDLAICLGGWNYVYGRAMPYLGGAYGGGLVTSRNVLDEFLIPLPAFDGAEPRVCVVAETDSYVFAATHLDYMSSNARIQQAKLITSVLKERYSPAKKPVFLAGDFNSEPSGEVMTYLFTEWILLSKATPTFPSAAASELYRGTHPSFQMADRTNSSTETIDYILWLNGTGDVRVLDGGVCASAPAVSASDHLPVWVELVF